MFWSFKENSVSSGTVKKPDEIAGGIKQRADVYIWQKNKYYEKDDVVVHGTDLLRCLVANSDPEIRTDRWEKIGGAVLDASVLPDNLVTDSDLLEYALKSEIPTDYLTAADIAGLARLEDIPVIPSDLVTVAELAGYARLEEVPVIPDDLVKTSDLADYARLADIPEAGVTEAELSEYAKKSDIPKGIITAADLTEYALLSDIPAVPDLSLYQKIADMPADHVTRAELSEYAKKSDIPGEIVTASDLAGYARTADTVTADELDAVLADYAKGSDIPEIPDLSIYQKIADMPTGHLTAADLEGYAKISDIPADTVKIADLESYAKKSDLAGLARAEDIPADTVTGTELNDVLAGYAKTADIPDTSVYLTKDQIQKMIDDAIAAAKASSGSGAGGESSGSGQGGTDGADEYDTYEITIPKQSQELALTEYFAFSNEEIENEIYTFYIKPETVTAYGNAVYGHYPDGLKIPVAGVATDEEIAAWETEVRSWNAGFGGSINGYDDESDTIYFSSMLVSAPWYMIVKKKKAG